MYKDLDTIRKELEDYYGTAAFNGNPNAMEDYRIIHEASDEDLADILRQHGIDVPEDD